MHTRKLLLTYMTVVALSATPNIAHADKLEGFDATMQVLDDAEDLEKAAAYFEIPDPDGSGEDTEQGDEAAESEITDPADFDDDFEHDVEFEEELMEDEDDFEDGDDVDDDRIGATSDAIS